MSPRVVGLAAGGAALPLELRQRRQWLLAAPDSNGWHKVPKTMRFGALMDGKSTDPNGWLTFDEAVYWAGVFGLAIGYVCHCDDPFTVIDLDVKNRVNAPGKPETWTSKQVIEGFSHFATKEVRSYTEVSLSGQGLHIWVRGKIGRGVKRAGVELYSQERFVVCTGNAWLPYPIENREALVLDLAAQLREAQGPRASLVEVEPREPDADVFKRIFGWSRGSRNVALVEGRWEELGYPSQSEADAALVETLCHATTSNEQCRRLFWASALGQRPKAHREGYVDGMIAFARGMHAAKHAQFLQRIGRTEGAQ